MLTFPSSVLRFFLVLWFWPNSAHFDITGVISAKGQEKISNFLKKSRWTLYALKIEVLVQTPSNFVCVLMIRERSFPQVCNFMSINYDFIIAVFRSFFELLVFCSFSACSCNIFALFFNIESLKVFRNFETSNVGMTS